MLDSAALRQLPGTGVAQGMSSGFFLAVAGIVQQQQRQVEKDLFGFGLVGVVDTGHRGDDHAAQSQGSGLALPSIALACLLSDTDDPSFALRAAHHMVWGVFPVGEFVPAVEKNVQRARKLSQRL